MLDGGGRGLGSIPGPAETAVAPRGAPRTATDRSGPPGGIPAPGLSSTRLSLDYLTLSIVSNEHKSRGPPPPAASTHERPPSSLRFNVALRYNENFVCDPAAPEHYSARPTRATPLELIGFTERFTFAPPPALLHSH